MRSCLPLWCLLVLGCEGGDPPASNGDTPPIVLRHDFGIIPHGERPIHEFALNLPAELGPLVPLNYQGDCSCTSYEIVLRHSDGSERAAPGFRQAEYVIGPDEQLILRLAVDTSQKEAVDMPPITSHGILTLQDPDGQHGLVKVGVVFTYGIDSPVRLRPTAHLAFPSLPRSRHLTIPVELHSDVAEQISFGPVHSSDVRLQGKLIPSDGFTLLEATFTPRPDDVPGTFHAMLTVETDLNGYRLDIPVSGRVTSDIVVFPARISLGRFDFKEPGAEQFVNVTDHLRRRDTGFIVHALRNQNGADASDHFEVRLQTIDGDSRSTRVYVRYTGGLEPPHFRGELILAVHPEDGPFVTIELVAFHILQE